MAIHEMGPALAEEDEETAPAPSGLGRGPTDLSQSANVNNATVDDGNPARPHISNPRNPLTAV